jgi:hypothetical protein
VVAPLRGSGEVCGDLGAQLRIGGGAAKKPRGPLSFWDGAEPPVSIASRPRFSSCLWAVLESRWLLAGVLGGLASAADPTMIVLASVLGLAALRNCRTLQKRRFLQLCSQA